MRFSSFNSGNIVVINGNNNATIHSSGNGLVIINGKVVSGELPSHFSYDETKVVDGKIAKVIVESTVASVTINPTESTDATIIYRGYASVVGNAISKAFLFDSL